MCSPHFYSGVNPFLGHVDRSFVRFRVTQKSREVDENPLSYCHTGQSLRPSEADNEGSLLNRVGGLTRFPDFLPAAEDARDQRSWDSRSTIDGSSRSSRASTSGAWSVGPR